MQNNEIKYLVFLVSCKHDQNFVEETNGYAEMQVFRFVLSFDKHHEESSVWTHIL